ncbi:hypothetical protein CLOSTMETH_01533 [[Clostridium] methylpentosum DSM 5476]|uniref:Uncharacterized protein n=1 Tax=[Clostridium] methylpentosum DSM 5476 TaxID=537013 RepID=C0ECG3_9FIRM|nr:hypothetical protein CLOSTMETH_01533 [[Clostridium] methylpentosum DSM 5476]
MFVSAGILRPPPGLPRRRFKPLLVCAFACDLFQKYRKIGSFVIVKF